MKVPSNLFSSFFKPSIRVMLDWKQVESCPIEVRVISKVETLTKWYLPWYIGHDNQEVEYRDLSSKPLALSNIEEVLPFLYAKRQKTINEIVNTYKKSRPPIQLIIPTFALKDNRFLILDCSHRLSALYISKVDFTLLVFTILGPLDNHILPDLHHWV